MPAESFIAKAILVALVILHSLGKGERFRFSKVALDSTEPPQRTDACFQSCGDIAVLFGGRQGPKSLSDTWIFHSQGNFWSRIKTRHTNSPTARYAAFCTVVAFLVSKKQCYVYLFGGRNTNQILTEPGGWVFDTEQQTWTKLSIRGAKTGSVHTLPKADNRSFSFSRAWAVGGLIASSGKVVISHGLCASGPCSNTLEVKLEAFNRGLVYEVHSPVGLYNIDAPHSLARASSTVVQSIHSTGLVVYGGCYYRGRCPNKDAWLFRVHERKWHLLPQGPLPKFGGVMVSSLPSMKKTGLASSNAVIHFGGSSFSSQTSWSKRPSAANIALLNTATRQWTLEEVAGMPSPLGSILGSNIAIVGSERNDDLRYIIFGGEYSSAPRKLVRGTFQMEFDANSRPKHARQVRLRYGSALTVHACLMGLAFGGFLAFGFFVARHFRFFSQNRTWFTLHYMSQSVATVLVWLGALAIFTGAGAAPRIDHPHAILGVTIVTLMSLQIGLALPCIRPQTDDNPFRDIWSLCHRWSGRFSFFGGLINCILGLQLILAPRILWIAFIVLACAIVASSFAVEYYICVSRFKKKTLYARYNVADDFGSRHLDPEEVSPDSDRYPAIARVRRTTINYSLDWYTQ